MERITFDDILKFHANWFKSIRSEALITGNLKQNKAVELCQKLEQMLSSLKKDSSCLPKELIPEVRVINIPSGSTWFYEHLLQNQSQSDFKETNSAIVSFF